MDSEVFKLHQIILYGAALNQTLHLCSVKYPAGKAVNFCETAARLALRTLIASFQVIGEAVHADDRGALVLVRRALAELWIVHGFEADEAFEVLRHFAVLVNETPYSLPAHFFSDGERFFERLSIICFLLLHI